MDSIISNTTQQWILELWWVITNTYSGFFIQSALGVIKGVLQLSLSLGECCVGRVQLLHLSLQVEVLLCETSLQVVEIVILLTEVINLDLEPPALVIEGISFAFGMSLKDNVSIILCSSFSVLLPFICDNVSKLTLILSLFYGWSSNWSKMEQVYTLAFTAASRLLETLSISMISCCFSFSTLKLKIVALISRPVVLWFM